MKRTQSFLFVLFLTLFLTQALVSLNYVRDASALRPSEQDAIITGSSTATRSGSSTYVTGLWGLDYTELNILTEGQMTFEGFAKAIERYFLPMNIRFVMLWINWAYRANTTTSNLIYYTWVDTWLSVSDQYGISNIFYFRQWSANYQPPSWDWDVYNQFPELQTFNDTGYPVNPQTQPQMIPGSKKAGSFFAPDNPKLYYQLKEDLKQICEYYGEHPSWVGIANFYGDYATYGSRDTSTRYVGWGNDTVQNFANTEFFQGVNSTGYHSDGTSCKVWEMFLNESDPIKLVSGNWQDSDPLDVYGGTATGGNSVAFKFLAPENLEGFKISFYGRVLGSPPSSLNIELYQNDGAYEDLQTYGQDKPKRLGTSIETQTISTTSTTPGWSEPVSFHSRLAKGSYYWLLFQTSGGSASNKYQIYRRSYKLDESTTRFVTDGYSSYWSYAGSAVLKILDQDGKTLKIYPYEKLGISTNSGSSIEQTFTPKWNIEVNTVVVHVSDRFYDDTGYSTVKIVRVSDNAVLAQGTLDQMVMNGLYWFIPISLNTTVSLQANVQYRIRIDRAVGEAWQFHYLATDPAELGFGGSQDSLGAYPDRDLVFRLAYFGNLSFKNYMHLTELNNFGAEVGKPGVTTTNWLAIRFKPSFSASFSFFSIRIYSKYGSPSEMSFSLYGGTSTQPTGSALETIIVPNSEVPGGGWVNVTGWAYNMTANNYYWMVMKANSSDVSSGYRPTRVPNPYLNKWVWSGDSGATWRPDKEEGDVGDFILRAKTSANEIFASEPDVRLAGSEVGITSTRFIAQSFSVTSNQTIRGFLVGIERSSGDSGNDISLELQTDSDGKPSGTSIMKGSLPYERVSHDALYYLNLDFPVNLTANTKYWIVFKSRLGASVKAPLYAFKTPQESYGGTEYGAASSADGGIKWGKVNGLDSDIIFAPVEAISAKAYNTTSISNDIKSYHVKRWTDDPLSGWNAYLNYMPSKLFYQAVDWLSGYLGREMVAFDVPTMRMIEKFGGLDKSRSIVYGAIGPFGVPPSGTYFTDDAQSKINGWSAALKASSIDTYPWFVTGNTLDNGGYITPEQVQSYYLMTHPILAPAVQILDTGGLRGISNLTQHEYSRSFGETLSRMRYYGGHFGSEKGAANVLLIGDSDVGIVPQFLTPALNITFLGFYDINGDSNLTRFGDFNQFDAIVFWAGRPSMGQMSANAQQRIKNFVYNGGGIVSSGGWASWANEIFGDGTGSEGPILPSDHMVWKPYEEADFISPRPHICERNYGSGRGVHISPKKSIGKIGTDPDIYGAPRDSWIVLLTNSILYAAGRESNIPAWWYPEYRDFQPWHDELYYSIDGRPGEPVLLWVSNNATNTGFEIHLNATFYGIDPAGWIAIDVQNWRVAAKGSGTDININTSIPSRSWMPIYITNASSNLSDLNSNTFSSSQNSNVSSASSMLEGPYSQAGWLMLDSVPTAINVVANTLVLCYLDSAKGYCERRKHQQSDSCQCL